MLTVTTKDIESLVKSREDFLQQLKIKDTGMLFGIGDLVVEIIRPLSEGTVIAGRIDFLLDVFAYISGLEKLALQKFPRTDLDLDEKTLDSVALLESRAALGHGTIKINKKLLKSLMYYDEQVKEKNIFSDWCTSEANRIQRKYQIPKDELQKMPSDIYKVIFRFLNHKQTLTRGEEMYISFLNDSIGVALERLFEDLGLVPFTLYNLRANTPKNVNNTYCKYCHKAIHRGDAGDSCTKKDNRNCFERNIGSRTKRRSTNELIFVNARDKVCVSCGLPLEYSDCRIVGDTLLCKNPKCYEKLKYKRKKQGL